MAAVVAFPSKRPSLDIHLVPRCLSLRALFRPARPPGLLGGQSGGLGGPANGVRAVLPPRHGGFHCTMNRCLAAFAFNNPDLTQTSGFPCPNCTSENT